MPEDRIRVAPNTVAYADRESHKLVVEFAIPGAPTETIDVKILEDSVPLTAPARNIEYVSALALGWPVKPNKAEATYEHGLLRIEVSFKDPMEGAVKVAIKTGGAETQTKTIEGKRRSRNSPMGNDPFRPLLLSSALPLPLRLFLQQRFLRYGKHFTDGVVEPL